MMISNFYSNAIQKNRIKIILLNAQCALNACIPTQTDFLEYQDEILTTEGNEQDIEILQLEKELENESKSLNKLLTSLKHHDNKTEFVIERAKLHHVDSKRSKHKKILERALKENPTVLKSIYKIDSDDLEWIKRKLDVKEFELFRNNPEELHSCITSSKLQKLSDKETLLSQELSVLKKNRNNLELKEQVSKVRHGIVILKDKIENILIENCVETYRVDLNAKKEATMKKFQEEEADLKAQIDSLKSKIELEKLAHQQLMLFHQDIISELSNNIEELNRTHKEQMENLCEKLTRNVSLREANLEMLLGLRRRLEIDHVV